MGKVFICIIGFILGVSSILFAQEVSVDFQDRQLETITKKIHKNNKTLKKKKQSRTSVKKKLITLTKELRITELQLKRAKRQLSSSRKKIRKKKKKIHVLSQQVDIKSEVVANRLLELYKHPDQGFLLFLFSPNQYFSDFTGRYFFSKIMHQDYDILKGLTDAHTMLFQEKSLLDDSLYRINQIRKVIVSKELLLTRKKHKKKNYLSVLESETKTIEKHNRELQKSSRALAVAIKNINLKEKVYYGSGTFIKPVLGWLSSRFGFRRHPIFRRRIKHNGLDFAAPKGRPIKATDSGVVVVSGQKSEYRGYGKVTVIHHGYQGKNKKPISSVYAHQSRILVQEGDYVHQGQEIGWVGSTGYSTGPHLHFEIRVDGIPTNPLHYLK